LCLLELNRPHKLTWWICAD